MTNLSTLMGGTFQGAQGPAGPVIATVTFDGSGAVLTAGLKCRALVPVTCNITSWTAIANVAGGVEVTVKRGTYDNYPNTTNIGVISIMNANTKNTDTTLTGWTTALAANNFLEFEVTGSPTTISRVDIQLKGAQ